MSDSIAHHEHPGGVHQFVLNRPNLRNALGTREYEFLADVLQAMDAPACKAIVLTGTGPTFCGGNELGEFDTAWPQPEHGPVYRFLAALHACPCPVIAAVHGGAVGIGATLLLHCDVVLASPQAFLRYPFVGLGISVEGGSSLLLPARLGHVRAMDLLLTGRKVAAPEACQLGLVTEVVEGDAGAIALERAKSISRLDGAAVRAIKRQLRAWQLPALPRLFEQEIQVINELLVARRSGEGA